MARLRQRTESRWEIIIELGKDHAGKRKQRSLSFQGTRGEAELELARVKLREAEGQYITTDLTVGRLCQAWIAHQQGVWSPVTTRCYTLLARRAAEAPWAQRPINELRPREIERWYATGNTTMTLMHKLLCGAFNHAVIEEVIPKTVFSLVRPPAATKATISAPQESDVLQLLKSTHHEPVMQTLIALAVSTGARRGTLAALQIGDFDDGAKTGTQKRKASLRIERRVVVAKGGLQVLPGTKTGPPRTIWLGEGTAGLMARWIEDLHRTSTDLFNKPATSSSYLFSRDYGMTPVQPNWITREFRRLNTEANVPKMRFHDLRHFAATEMLASGLPVTTVAHRLGHARISTTLSFYAHSTDELDQQAADTCGSTLDNFYEDDKDDED